MNVFVLVRLGIVFSFVIIACNNTGRRNAEVDSDYFKWIHDFRDNDSNLLGRCYVHYIDSNKIFDKILILKNNNLIIDTILSGNLNIYKGKNGELIEKINRNDIHGYSIQKKLHDYLLLTPIDKYYKTIDNFQIGVGIGWNGDKKFEVVIF